MASDAESPGTVRRDLPPPSSPASTGGRSLWLWVGAAFLFLGLLWTAMVFAARAADSRTVPLQTREAKP